MEAESDVEEWTEAAAACGPAKLRRTSASSGGDPDMEEKRRKMERAREEIRQLKDAVGGGAETQAALLRSSCYLEKAQVLLKCLLEKRAGVSPGDAFFDEEDYVGRLLQDLRRVQSLREDWNGFFIRKSTQKEDLVAQPKPCELPQAQGPVSDLGHAQVVLQYTEKLIRSAYVLTRLLEEPDSSVLKDHLMDPFATFQQKRFERIWSRAYDREEGAECAKGSEDRKVVQILVEHCIDQALVHKYRRYDNFVFEEVKASFDGRTYGTRAFKLVAWPDGDPKRDKGTLDEFFVRACNKDVFPKMWELSLDPGIKSKVVEDMVTGIELEFPRLIRQRRLLSFRNGILDTQAEPCGAFYPYEQLDSSGLEPKQASSKFFDLVVDTQWFDRVNKGEDWFDAIPTPKFQSILDYQNLGRKAAGAKQAAAAAAVDVTKDEDVASLEHVRVRMQRRVQAFIDSCETHRHIQAFLDSCENAILDSRYAREEEDERGAMNALPAFCDALIAEFTKLKTELARDVELGERLRPEAAEAADESMPLEERRQEYEEEKAGRGQYDRPGSSLPREVQKWVYVFLGRLLHELGAFDTWQIMPFLKGRAGTGKSAIGDIIQRFFEPEQVGILSSNVEATFGLSAIADKFIMLCLEVKKDFRLNQAEFQSLVSGEMVSLAVKNKQPYQKKWTAPGLLCGNEWAGYQDTQGSIARRLAVVNFRFPISSRDSNPNLVKEIVEEELAALIVKCNVAYREMARAKKGQDIWKILPEYFRYQRRILQVDTDPIWATIFDPSLFSIDAGEQAGSYVAMETFFSEYREKWRQLRGNSFAAPLTEDTMASALQEAQLSTGTIADSEADPPRWKKVIFGLKYVKPVVQKEGGGEAA
jgi:Family of unknown function (DUF5906)